MVLHHTGKAAAERFCGIRHQSVTRDEYLNETLFSSLTHVRAVLTAWKGDYNTVRPCRGLGNLQAAHFTDRQMKQGSLGYERFYLKKN